MHYYYYYHYATNRRRHFKFFFHFPPVRVRMTSLSVDRITINVIAGYTNVASAANGTRKKKLWKKKLTIRTNGKTESLGRSSAPRGHGAKRVGVRACRIMREAPPRTRRTAFSKKNTESKFRRTDFESTRFFSFFPTVVEFTRNTVFQHDSRRINKIITSIRDTITPVIDNTRIIGYVPDPYFFFRRGRQNFFQNGSNLRNSLQPCYIDTTNIKMQWKLG